MIQILDRGELIQRFEYVDDMAGGQMELFRKTGQRDILLEMCIQICKDQAGRGGRVQRGQRKAGQCS